MQKENIDYMHFVSPYATTSRIKRHGMGTLLGFIGSSIS